MKNKLVFLLLLIVMFTFLTADVVSGQTGFQEVKLRSQLFNGVIVGKTIIPAG